MARVAVFVQNSTKGLWLCSFSPLQVLQVNIGWRLHAKCIAVVLCNQIFLAIPLQMLMFPVFVAAGSFNAVCLVTTHTPTHQQARGPILLFLRSPKSFATSLAACSSKKFCFITVNPRVLLVFTCALQATGCFTPNTCTSGCIRFITVSRYAELLAGVGDRC